MPTKYKATEADKAYFITITTVGWGDISHVYHKRVGGYKSAFVLN